MIGLWAEVRLHGHVFKNKHIHPKHLTRPLLCEVLGALSGQQTTVIVLFLPSPTPAKLSIAAHKAHWDLLTRKLM